MKELNFDNDNKPKYDYEIHWQSYVDFNVYWHTCDDDQEPEPGDDGEYMDFLDSMLDEEES